MADIKTRGSEFIRERWVRRQRCNAKYLGLNREFAHERITQYCKV